MAIKALGQISIIDLTDGYTVSLDRDSGSFTADSNYHATNNTTQFSVNVSALQGTENINSVKIGTCTIKDAGGVEISSGAITATAASGNVSPVTITVYGGSGTPSFTGEMATVAIPVYVEGDPNNPNLTTDIVIVKTFTISASPQGAGGQSSYTYIRYASDNQGTNMSDNPSDSLPYMGIAVTNSATAPADASAYAPWTKYLGEDGTNGSDGVTYYIHSSNGTYFKNTSAITRLTLHIYKADGSEAEIPENLHWYKGDPNSQGSTDVTVAAHRSYIDLAAGDVTDTETYFVALVTQD